MAGVGLWLLLWEMVGGRLCFGKQTLEKTQPDWAFQSFDLRGNVTAKPEDVLAPCWRNVSLHR